MTFTFYLHWWEMVLLALWLGWRVFVNTWTHFLAIFFLRDKSANLTGFPRFVAYWVILPRGILYDFLLNMLATIPFADMPRETLLTARLQRYYDGPPSWRKRFATWINESFIEPYDPGHIKIR